MSFLGIFLLGTTSASFGRSANRLVRSIPLDFKEIALSLISLDISCVNLTAIVTTIQTQKEALREKQMKTKMKTRSHSSPLFCKQGGSPSIRSIRKSTLE